MIDYFKKYRDEQEHNKKVLENYQRKRIWELKSKQRTK